MANRYAVANGNWSSTSTWDGGTLPTSEDDVRANGFTVNINQNITVLSIQTTVSSPAVGGGLFDVTIAGLTINANIIAGTSTTNGCVRMAIAGNLTINGNINGGTVNTSRGIFINNAGANVYITGNVTGGTTSNATAVVNNNGFVQINGNSTGGSGGSSCFGTTGQAHIYGNVTGGAGSDSYGFAPSRTDCIVVGDITGGVGVTAVGLFNFAGAGATLTITGNIVGGPTSGAYGFWNNGNGNVNITGNMTGGPSAPGGLIFPGSTGTVNINGIVQGGPLSAGNVGLLNQSALSIVNIDIAIGSTTTGAVGFSTSVVTNPNLFVKSAVYTSVAVPIGGSIRFNGLTPSVTVLITSGTLTLTDPTTTDQANPTDVRNGVTYNSGGLLGTLVVPLPSQVSLGIATDNTFGTGILTSNDFLNAIITSPDPVAERLRNVATVQTVGDQFNAFGKEP